MERRFAALVLAAILTALSAGCAGKQVEVSSAEMGKPAEAEKAVSAPREEPAKPAPAPIRAEPLKKSVEPATPAEAVSGAVPASDGRKSIEESASASVASSGNVQSSPLEPVHFDFDSYLLSSRERDLINANKEKISGMGRGAVVLEGHCDERGDAAYNMSLGQKRADAVLDYLVRLGISADRLSAVSFGEERPVDPGHGEAAWAKNRRVEFVLK